jgi:hypothetical protein
VRDINLSDEERTTVEDVASWDDNELAPIARDLLKMDDGNYDDIGSWV